MNGRRGHGDRASDRRPVTRRDVLGLAGGAVTAFAGCSAGGGANGNRGSGGGECGETPDPVSIGGETGDARGMVIGVHPGPVGEIFYCDHEPSGHANPARFASIRSLFSYYFGHRHRGWRASALYVTDYSTLDYSVVRSGGRRVVTVLRNETTESGRTTNGESTEGGKPTMASGMTDARTATYVVDSDVAGAMGAALVPFSARADAASFAERYHGNVQSFGEIDPGLLASSGW